MTGFIFFEELIYMIFFLVEFLSRKICKVFCKVDIIFGLPRFRKFEKSRE